MVTYKDSVNGVLPEHLEGFFVGWPNPPNPATHLRLLEGSDIVVIAVDDETSSVVGFITAITDGVLAAFIPLLEVLPTHQGKGIGGQLVKRAVARMQDLYSVDLLCDADVQPFYENLGFRKAEGMFIRNYANQGGGAR
jgi:GNAT superfamily N-acetyltransferase